MGPFLEPLAVLTGIASVALTVRQHIVNWPIGIVSSALFLLLFSSAGPMPTPRSRACTWASGFYGWWHWLRGGPSGSDLPVTSACGG